MNTIPLTFDEHQIERTIIGGRRNNDKDALDISIILLNSSGSHFKISLFENLVKCNFKSIISVENDSSNYNLEDISKKFPSVKFIVPLEKTNDGELINLAMSEADGEYVLVLKDKVSIPFGKILPNLASKVVTSGVYCIVPRLFDENKSAIPCAYSPRAEGSHFEIDSSTAVTDGMRTLYPFDYIAMYNREKFIKLGGYDWTISSPYWQILDLGIRSWLWGEETRLTSLLQFSYIDEAPIPDITANIDYLRYYLKNELPKLKMEQGYLKKSSFFVFKHHSSCGLFEAKRQFACAKEWVEKNKYRFKMDLQTFIENWGNYEK